MITGLLLVASLVGTPDAPAVSDPNTVDAAVATQDADVPVPVRRARPWTLSAELGANTLVGEGITLGYNFTPRWTLEIGLGVSPLGLKTGLRTRYNFLESTATPFVGLGLSYASGAIDSSTQSWTYGLSPSLFAQGLVGLSVASRNGFTFLIGGGWSQLLTNNGACSPKGCSHDSLGLNPIVYGSGPVLNAAFGYAF